MPAANLPSRNRILANLDITALGAGTYTGEPVSIPFGTRNLGLQANFVHGAAGTTVDVAVEGTFDGGATWFEVADFAFTTADLRKAQSLKGDVAIASFNTATALADDAIRDGIIPDMLRTVTVVAGTYTGTTTLRVDVCPS